MEDEIALMEDKKVRLLVTKNSGGIATKAKLDAARQLGVGVVMVRRPPREPLEYVSGISQAIQWLSTHGV